MSNKELFREIYAKTLMADFTKHPTDYFWPLSELPTVVDKMTEACARGSAHLQSRAIKAAMKQLALKNRTELMGFLKGSA